MRIRHKRSTIILAAIAAGVTLAQTPDGADNSPRQGPKILQPAAEGVGRLIPDATFQDIEGRPRKLSDFRDSEALVIVMTSTSCPVAKRYLPTLTQLETGYRQKSIAFLYVDPTRTDSRSSIHTAIADNHLKGVYTQDLDGALQQALQPKTTTETFLLDKSRTLLYRGAADDQYGLAYQLDQPRQRYLAAAINAALQRQAPAIRATSAPGCALETPPPEAPKSAAITYHNRISRIVQTHCAECHRDGGVAPFALTTLPDVASHAAMIRQVVDRGTMPPWFAAPTKAQPHSPWMNDRTLPAADKADLLAWLTGGRPEGDKADAALAREFPSGWLIGKPDAVFEFREPVAVKASGSMPYQNITVETGLEEDKWVRALEVRPGNRAVVHHVLVFVETSVAGPRDDAAEARGGFYAIYVPGNSTLVYPEGYAKRLPKGARLRFQVHYTPNGTAATDQTKLGVIYADAPPRHEVRVIGLANIRLSIPPGDSNHQDSAELKLPFDVQILSFLPHLHLRGKAGRYEAADGDVKTLLLDVPRYDFNWQLLYRYAEPPTFKAGTTLKFTAWYDNSTGNPANPDPTKTVRWGPQTYEEMLLGYVEYVVPNAKPGEPATLSRTAAGGGAGLFRYADADGDGKVTKDEFKRLVTRIPALADNPAAADRLFERLDENGDGALSESEFGKLRELRRN